MNKGYESFLAQNGSHISSIGYKKTLFKTYQFSSSIGQGTTAIYEVEDYASICVADHTYYEDFEYTVPVEASISIQQYDSIESEHSNPSFCVYAGMHFIEKTQSPHFQSYTIKKRTPAKLIGVQLLPKYYEEILKSTLGERYNLLNVVDASAQNMYIPEVSFALNQIKNFQGTGIGAKLFYKSKIDEIVSFMVQKFESLHQRPLNLSCADHLAISQTFKYISLNLEKDLCLSHLAHMACMSPSKFKYAFKAVAGTAFSQYLLQKRMERACDLLLNSNLYIGEIAHKLGYKKAGSFSVQFRKYTGVLPTAYRLKKSRSEHS